MMKRFMVALTALALLISNTVVPITAEEDFASNEEYYQKLCSKAELSPNEKNVCRDFAYYMSGKSSELSKKLEEIEAKRDSLAKDISGLSQKIKEYESEIVTLSAEITQLDADISALEIQITEKEAEITAKEGEVEALKAKVKARMENAQGTMRLNQYLDVIMGAESLTDLIRRINGINDIMNYDAKVQDELKELILYLNEIKAQLEIDKADIVVKRAEVQSKREIVLANRVAAEEARTIALQKEAELEEQGRQYLANIDNFKSQINAISDKINEIIPSGGWMKPTSGTNVSAGTWHYPSYGKLSGGVHLGLDLAGPIGVSVKAVANGIIIKAVDGCDNNGYLGNSCGSSQGGTAGGGNQVLMLAKVDGILYAIKYLHLSAGLSVSDLQEVSQGDVIAKIGNSGNTTGPHLHIEIYKLGSMSITSYLNSWDGNLSFGCGWGTAALNRICSSSGAPCRARPEEILGY